MIEAVAEMDDDLTAKYLEGEELTAEEHPPRPAAGHAPEPHRPGPHRLGAEEQGRPADARRGRRITCRRRSTCRRSSGIDPDTGAELLRTVDDKEPFAALAFKIAADPFVGKLAFFRVYSGRLKAGSYVLNASKGKRERIGRILQMHANHREDIDEVYAGDIAAAVGLKDTYTGDTLSDPEHPIILESMTFPEPVIEVAIEPKTKADQDKLGVALQRLAEEDPTFRVHTDEETGQTLIAGMGELHLDVLVDRMVREFKVAANVGKPQVAYRETIRKARPGQRALRAPDRRPRPVRPRGHQARAQREGRGLRVRRQDRGRHHPPRVHQVGRRGHPARRSRAGVYAGYPMVDVKATLFDGSFHEVDSSEMAFKIAGSMALKDAVEQGRSDDPRAGHARSR